MCFGIFHRTMIEACREHARIPRRGAPLAQFPRALSGFCSMRVHHCLNYSEHFDSYFQKSFVVIIVEKTTREPRASERPDVQVSITARFSFALNPDTSAEYARERADVDMKAVAPALSPASEH